MKRANDDNQRIRVLEKEVATLKASIALKTSAAAAAADAAAESLPSLLTRLQLKSHEAMLDSEELDVTLLKSMGRDDLLNNMVDLGMSADEAGRLADALFPVALS